MCDSNTQFGTKCISRAFGSNLCLNLLLVGASVAAMVPSQRVLAAHTLRCCQIGKGAQLRLGCRDPRAIQLWNRRPKLEIHVAAGNDRRTRCTWACFNGDRSWPSVVAEQEVLLRSVIFDMITKTSRLEVSRERDDEGALLPPRILHKTQDEGSIGLLAAHWLNQCAGLRNHDDGGPTASQVQRHEGCHHARELLDLQHGALCGVQWPAGPSLGGHRRAMDS